MPRPEPALAVDPALARLGLPEDITRAAAASPAPPGTDPSAWLLNLLQSYAADYRNKSLTDEKAQKLLDEWIALEKDDAKHRKSYAPKVLQALPAKKAARYLQIENEYRILMRYDLAATVPLVQ